MLPDHPSLAPESLGNLFDNTEIEEALLLHVHALSDGEREEIAEQDPAVREMIERAAAATPEDMISLHGKLTPAGQTDTGAASSPRTRRRRRCPPTRARPPSRDIPTRASRRSRSAA